MIEVPPPQSFDGRNLRYGAMTCREYIWFRAKWSFVAALFTVSIGIWEFTLGYSWDWVWGVILFVSTATNVAVALNWRKSWQFWHASLGWWLDAREMHEQAKPYLHILN